ncbi:MAG: arginase family protein [Chloroflexota bacterium]|nr:arginase family protein [Chloroflexota bacterium]
MSNRTVAVLGAPTAAGAHWPGQEKAPAAFRAAGLADRLDRAGVAWVDRGDLPLAPWQVARTEWAGGAVNNLDAVVAYAERVRDEVFSLLGDGAFPVVPGGDCTITVGAVAGAIRAGHAPGLIYVDGGWDLSSPAMYPAGIMDSMGLGHMLDLPNVTRLAGIAGARPMLTPERFVQFGHGTGASDGPEETLAREQAYLNLPNGVIAGRGAEAAREALAMLPADLPAFWLHFDVDVIDFFDAPVADVPLHGNGLPYADAFAAVRVFANDRRCLGMTVTEFNPDHASAQPGLTERFVSDLADVLRG